MAYSSGQTVLANDINTFLGKVRNVYGAGSGDRGYGQTAVSQADVTVGENVTAAHWVALRNMIVTCANHQGTSITSLMAAPSIGQSLAASGTLSGIVDAVDTNRLNAAAASMTLTSAAHTVTRSSAWNATITATVVATFTNANAMRYYFNAGGQVRLRMAHPTGTVAQDVDWRDILTNKVGTITLSANGTTRSGSAGTASAAIGFHQLTGTAQNIYSGNNIGGGAYASNDVTVTALKGTNTVTFTITLADQHTNTFYDSVSTGTNVTFDVYRATTHLTGIAAPTFSTSVAF